MDATWIANEHVVFVHATGDRVPGVIAVGLPVQVTATEARCAIALEGLEVINIQVGGTTTLQALLLGVRYLGTRLHDFVSRGGRVEDPVDGSDVLESTFGPLLQPGISPPG
jgi:hypothetical protein